MSNLFSSFDPMVNIIDFSLSLNWLSAFIPLLFLPQIYWITSSQILKTVQNVITCFHVKPLAVLGIIILPGTVFIFFKIFLLSYILDESIDSSSTIKTIGHQWYWRDEYRNFLIADIRGIFIAFLLFTFTRLILFRSPWAYLGHADLRYGECEDRVTKLRPLKVKTHTPVKEKPKPNLPKKSG